jgi:outer membrane protein
MRRSILAPVLLSLLALPAAAAAQSAATKIGVVDFQRALNEVEEGKKAKKTLETRFEKARLTIEGKRAELQRIKEDLDTQSVMLAPDALRAKENDYQNRMMEFQQMLLENQQEMQLMEQELTGGILEKLFNTASGIGAEQGFNLIIESSAIVYVNGTQDITEQVIARFNTKK